MSDPGEVFQFQEEEQSRPLGDRLKERELQKEREFQAAKAHVDTHLNKKKKDRASLMYGDAGGAADDAHTPMNQLLGSQGRHTRISVGEPQRSETVRRDWPGPGDDESGKGRDRQRHAFSKRDRLGLHKIPPPTLQEFDRLQTSEDTSTSDKLTIGRKTPVAVTRSQGQRQVSAAKGGEKQMPKLQAVCPSARRAKGNSNHAPGSALRRKPNAAQKKAAREAANARAAASPIVVDDGSESEEAEAKADSPKSGPTSPLRMFSSVESNAPVLQEEKLDHLKITRSHATFNMDFSEGGVGKALLREGAQLEIMINKERNTTKHVFQANNKESTYIDSWTFRDEHNQVEFKCPSTTATKNFLPYKPDFRQYSGDPWCITLTFSKAAYHGLKDVLEPLLASLGITARNVARNQQRSIDDMLSPKSSADADGTGSATRRSSRRASGRASGAKRENKLVLTWPPGKGSQSIHTADVERLQEGEFLNDVIINFYLKYIEQDLLSPEQRERVLFFNSFFYKKLASGGDHYQNVARWTKTDGETVFDKDFVIIPVNEHAHWYLVVMCFAGLLQPEEEDVDPVEEIEVPDQSDEDLPAVTGEVRSTSPAFHRSRRRSGKSLFPNELTNAALAGSSDGLDAFRNYDAQKKHDNFAYLHSAKTRTRSSQLRCSKCTLGFSSRNELVDHAIIVHHLDGDELTALLATPDVVNLEQSSAARDAGAAALKRQEMLRNSQEEQDMNMALNLSIGNEPGYEPGSQVGGGPGRPEPIEIDDEEVAESQEIIDETPQPSQAETENPMTEANKTVPDVALTHTESVILIEPSATAKPSRTPEKSSSNDVIPMDTSADKKAQPEGYDWGLRKSGRKSATKSPYFTEDPDNDDNDFEDEPKERKPTKRRRTQSTRPTKKMPKRPCMLMFDSLGGGGRAQTTGNLNKYLNGAWAARREKHPELPPRTFDNKTFPMIRVEAPGQSNHCDCGVFVLHYVEKFLLGRAESMPAEEKRKASSMGFSDYADVNKRINKKRWFADKDIQGKRDHIKALIQEKVDFEMATQNSLKDAT